MRYNVAPVVGTEVSFVARQRNPSNRNHARAGSISEPPFLCGSSKVTKMTKAKRTTLLLIVAFQVLVILIAVSLPNLVLRPGDPFYLGQPQSLPFGSAGSLPASDVLIVLVRGALAVALVLFPFSLLYMLMTADGRRRLLGYIVLMILLLLLADYLRNHVNEVQQAQQPITGSPVQELLSNAPDTSVFTPTPPSGLITAVALAVAILLALLIVAAIWFIRRRLQPPATPMQRLAEEVQTALESLHTGGDLKQTIIRCYQEMSRVVQEEKGLTRETAMTPREFEDELIGIGLPAQPIQTLTSLFERVRYGHTATHAQEEDLARACLTNIVTACQAGQRVHEN